MLVARALTLPLGTRTLTRHPHHERESPPSRLTSSSVKWGQQEHPPHRAMVEVKVGEQGSTEQSPGTRSVPSKCWLLSPLASAAPLLGPV